MASDSDQHAASSGPPVVADPQDPLPESVWFYRRLFIFSLSAAILFGVWWYVDTLATTALLLNETAIKGLVSILKFALWLIAGLITLYLIAPSAEQAGKWIATLVAWRSGVSTSSTASATAPSGATATATTTATPRGNPSPPIPPPSPTEDAAPR